MRTDQLAVKMTAAIQLTDPEREMFAASGLIVIGGERPPCPADTDGDGDCAACYRNPLAHGPLVAPEGWRILTEPCGTCGGDGDFFDDELGDDWMGHVCPDCVGGRRVVTLTATCPTCDGEGEGTYLAWHVAIPCPNLCKRGVVTLGRFTIPALLPVVTHHIKGAHVYVSAGGRVYTVEPNELQRSLTLDHLPRPGQFIPRPEPVPT